MVRREWDDRAFTWFHNFAITFFTARRKDGCLPYPFFLLATKEGWMKAVMTRVEFEGPYPMPVGVPLPPDALPPHPPRQYIFAISRSLRRWLAIPTAQSFLWMSDFWHPSLSLDEVLNTLSMVVAHFPQCLIRKLRVMVPIEGSRSVSYWPAVIVWKPDPAPVHLIAKWFPDDPENAFMASFGLVFPWMDETEEGEQTK